MKKKNQETKVIQVNLKTRMTNFMIVLMLIVRKLVNNQDKYLKANAPLTSRSRTKRSGKRSSKKRQTRLRMCFLQNSTR